MKISIVTHNLMYPKILCFHLSQFFHNCSWADISLALVTAEDDDPVREVVAWFKPLLSGCDLIDLCLPRDQVGRRTIGRNIAALGTDADWIFFTDADYWFTESFWASIGDILDAVPADKNLVFPRRVWGSTTLLPGNNTAPGSTTGDALLDSITPPQIVDLDPRLFQEPMSSRMAIGGSQWVRGDYCRKYGYLNGHTKHLRPSREWLRTIEDKAFRVALGSAGYPVDVDGIYRLRHSAHGGLNLPQGVTL